MKYPINSKITLANFPVNIQDWALFSKSIQNILKSEHNISVDTEILLDAFAKSSNFENKEHMNKELDIFNTQLLESLDENEELLKKNEQYKVRSDFYNLKHNCTVGKIDYFKNTLTDLLIGKESDENNKTQMNLNAKDALLMCEAQTTAEFESWLWEMSADIDDWDKNVVSFFSPLFPKIAETAEEAAECAWEGVFEPAKEDLENQFNSEFTKHLFVHIGITFFKPLILLSLKTKPITNTEIDGFLRVKLQNYCLSSIIAFFKSIDKKSNDKYPLNDVFQP